MKAIGIIILAVSIFLLAVGINKLFNPNPEVLLLGWKKVWHPTVIWLGFSIFGIFLGIITIQNSRR